MPSLCIHECSLDAHGSASSSYNLEPNAMLSLCLCSTVLEPQVDAAWDAAVAALKRVLEPAFSGATAAAQMLTVKDFLLLSCLALGGCARWLCLRQWWLCEPLACSLLLEPGQPVS